MSTEAWSTSSSIINIGLFLINGKSGALEKRIIEEGADSSADLYITADAGRCGAMDKKGHLQGGLTSKVIKALVFIDFTLTFVISSLVSTNPSSIAKGPNADNIFPHVGA